MPEDYNQLKRKLAIKSEFQHSKLTEKISVSIEKDTRVKCECASDVDST